MIKGPHISCSSFISLLKARFKWMFFFSYNLCTEQTFVEKSSCQEWPVSHHFLWGWDQPFSKTKKSFCSISLLVCLEMNGYLDAPYWVKSAACRLGVCIGAFFSWVLSLSVHYTVSLFFYFWDCFYFLSDTLWYVSFQCSIYLQTFLNRKNAPDNVQWHGHNCISFMAI